MGDERAPLLFSENNAASAQPLPSAPPAYTEAVYGGGLQAAGAADAQYRQSAVCEVCRANLTYTGRADLRVIRCNRCQENTAVGPPVPGSRFVRCECKALLTCSATSKIIICSRANCNRKIRVGAASSASIPTAAAGGQQRTTCPQCNVTVVGAASSFSPRHCHSCDTLLPIARGARRYTVRRVQHFIGFGLFMFILAIAGTVVSLTWSKISENQGVYVAPIALYVCAFLFLFRGLMLYCSIRGAPVV